MVHRVTIWLLFAQLLQYFLEAKAQFSNVPAVIVFGDSSVDSGNNNWIPTVLRSNFQPYGRDFFGGKPTGRFSNGRLPSDFISEAFGLKPIVPAYLDPNYSIKDFATGVCFASAGTGYDNATSHDLAVLPLWKELEYYKQYQQQLRHYLGNDKAKDVLEGAVYLLSMGTNDFLNNYYTRPGRSSEFTVQQYQDFLIRIAKKFIIDLYELGARKISLGGLPPMGCLPLERTLNIMRGRQCIEVYNQVAKEFNGKLTILVGKLNKELKGLQLVLSNPYEILLEMIQKPTSFGKRFPPKQILHSMISVKVDEKHGHSHETYERLISQITNRDVCSASRQQPKTGPNLKAFRKSRAIPGSCFSLFEIHGLKSKNALPISES